MKIGLKRVRASTGVIAQVFTLLCRRFAIGARFSGAPCQSAPKSRRLQTGDTADWKSAVLGCTVAWAALAAVNNAIALADETETGAQPGRVVATTGSESAKETKPATTEITSKQLRMDTEKKIAYFDGDVQVIDPEFLMRATRLVVHMNPNGSGMNRAEAFGEVVIVQESENRKAYCEKAVYTPADGNMVLTGNPRIEDEQGNVAGETIIINRNDNTITVQGGTKTRISLPTSSPEEKLKPDTPRASDSE